MNKKIMWIIDDDVIYQKIIHKLIQKTEVISSHASFTNGNEALNTLKNTIEEKNLLPDIILLDINMPIMDGWEFMEEIKIIKSKIDKRITIYMVSSSIAPEDKNKSKTFADIFDYISKPLSVNDLMTIVSNG
jgi:CheY-like chemotaxis protein